MAMCTSLLYLLFLLLVAFNFSPTSFLNLAFLLFNLFFFHIFFLLIHLPTYLSFISPLIFASSNVSQSLYPKHSLSHS